MGYSKWLEQINGIQLMGKTNQWDIQKMGKTNQWNIDNGLNKSMGYR